MTKPRVAVLVLLLSFLGYVAGYATAQNYYQSARLTVPAYGAGLAEPGSQTQQGQLDRLEAKVDKILKLLEELEDKPNDGKPAPGEAPSALRSAAGVCAKCHHTDVANEKGNGFAMFDEEGKFAKIADRDRRRLISYVSTGKMPPAPQKLSEAERKAMIGAFEAPPNSKE